MIQTLAIIAAQNPNLVAVSNESHAATYSSLLEDTRRFVDFLNGASRPLVVYVALPSGPHFTALQLGTLDTNSIVVPIPPRSTVEEAGRFFSIMRPDLLCITSRVQCRALISALPQSAAVLSLLDEPGEPKPPLFCWNNLSPSLLASRHFDAPGPEVPQEIRMVHFTSGSTGWPKAVLITKAQVLANQQIGEAHLQRFRLQPVFCPVPQFHAMGNAMALEHVLSLSPIHFANARMIGDHLQRIRDTRAFAILASPSYFRMLLSLRSFAAKELPALQIVTIGSDWIDAALLVNLRERFPQLRIFCRYGLTEAYGPLAYKEAAPGEPIPDERSLGRFLDGVELDLGRPGCAPAPSEHPLRLRSPTMSAHQLLHTGEIMPLLDNDGFLITGDCIETRHEGGLRLVGRESQFIKVNGFRVSPYEIEETLRQAEGVREAFVAGVPDPITGQRIVACVIASDGPPPSEERLKAFCLARLSAHKVPGTVLYDVSIPYTHSGKVARKQLAEVLAARFDARSRVAGEGQSTPGIGISPSKPADILSPCLT